ncbi:hypothetical protein Taro_001430 [Colocasia esculenta]|uniref:Uncharacterized protein n=1 Tax=Colocasia esculenta TaxID=4460 RepID=A0A843THU4_COLES|nr:hypothetical protein [Colocasia esculenta]
MRDSREGEGVGGIESRNPPRREERKTRIHRGGRRRGRPHKSQPPSRCPLLLVLVATPRCL